MNPLDLTPIPAGDVDPGEPRDGQWMTFDGTFDGAHHAADGRCVGIYRRRSITPRITRTTAQGEEVISEGGQVIPAHVAPVRPDGTNLMMLDPTGNHAVKVAFAPGDCPGLRPADVPGDLPRCDRTAHLHG